MYYKVQHITRYLYNEPVSLCHNVARLIPRSTSRQTCRSSVLTIDPLPDAQNEYEDFFGNKVNYFAIQQEHTSLTVTVTSELTRRPPAALEIDLYGHLSWEEVKVQLKGAEYADILQYIPETPLTAANEDIHAYACRSFTQGRPMFEATRELMERIFTDFKFQPGFTTIATPLSEVMRARKGVCQDFAHLAIACLRSLGLPARYISGYIETFAPEGKGKMQGADASHAWFAIFLPGSGWIEFDPTNNLLPEDRHLIIGWGRDYADIAPLKGVIVSSGQHQLSVSVDVRRIG